MEHKNPEKPEHVLQENSVSTDISHEGGGRGGGREEPRRRSNSDRKQEEETGGGNRKRRQEGEEGDVTEEDHTQLARLLGGATLFFLSVC